MNKNDIINKNSDALFELVKNSFGVQCNLSDFFSYACADSILIEVEDLEWILPIFTKYNWDGFNACVAFIAKKEPIEPWRSKTYLEAYEEIKELNPKVQSEY